VIHPNEEKDERCDACPENVFYHRAVERLVVEDLGSQGGCWCERYDITTTAAAVPYIASFLSSKLDVRRITMQTSTYHLRIRSRRAGLSRQRSEGVELEIIRNDLSNYEKALEKVSMDL
jgi:hypothetical protein